MRHHYIIIKAVINGSKANFANKALALLKNNSKNKYFAK